VQSPMTHLALHRLCTKSPYTLISLCNLCVLCVSVVCFCSQFINHREHRDCTEKRAHMIFQLESI